MIRPALLRLSGLLRADSATQEQRARLRTWAVLVVGVFVGQIVWMALLRGQHILDRDNVLIMGQLILGMGLVGIAGLIVTTPHDAIRLDESSSRRAIFLGTVVLQALAVLTLWPALSDEPPRYRVDGATWLSGRSPYVTPPILMKDSRLIDDLDNRVKGRGQRSIYPPVAQTVFIAARGIELLITDPVKLEQPARTWRESLPQLKFAQRALIMRLFAAAAAIACTWVLLRILRDRGVTPWLAVLLAWNPLLLLEAGGAGHVDIIGILLVLVMFRMLQTGNLSLATLALCLACGVKPTAILLAPLLVRQIWQERNWRSAQRSILVVVATLVLVYLPILSVQSGMAGWISAIQNFAQQEKGNSLTLAVLGNNTATRMLPPFIAVGVLLWVLRRRINLEDASYWLLLATLLASPSALPRMVLWPLCIVPMLRHSFGWAALAWSATVAFAYAMWHQPGAVIPSQILAAQYLPVALALVIQVRESYAWKPAPIPADAAASA